MEYRVYVLGKAGQILSRHELAAESDAAAMGYARQYAINSDVEVWHEGRRIGELKFDKQREP